MEIIRKRGFDFGFDPGACKSCPGHCCCGESGYIWLTHRDVLVISSYLKLHAVDFVQKYLDRIDNRFSLKERRTENDFECVFFSASQKQCVIYEVRPSQCRQFPFWEHFRKHKDERITECPGIKTL